MSDEAARPWWRTGGAVVGMATSLAIVWATARGLARGFEPIGDNALVELRARDVLTSRHPLLGTWSSASLGTGDDVNHPGPLLFDLFALPVRLLGRHWGIAVGAASINLAALWSSVLVARRIAGDLTALAVAVAYAGLVWSMGSELLYDVWMPNVLILPAFAFTVMAWAAATGSLRALAAAVAVGSVCAQVHGSYLILVPVVLAAATVAAVARRWRQPGMVPGLAVAAATGAVCWAQPLWEQLTGRGDGNLTRLLSASGGDDRIGLGLATRLVANVAVVPPGWLRPGLARSVPSAPWTGSGTDRVIDGDGIVSLPIAVASLVVAALLIGLLARHAHRRADVVTVAGIQVLAVSAVVALGSTAFSPLDDFGLTPHKLRYLFAVGALAAAVVASGSLRLLADRTGGLRSAVPPIVVGAGCLMAMLALPTHRIAGGPNAQHATWASITSLRDQMGEVEQVGTVWFDLDERGFAEPYSYPIMAEMDARDVDFRVRVNGEVRQVGEGRRFVADEVDTRLFMRIGAGADASYPDARRIALAGAGTEQDPLIAVFLQPYAADG